jgi:hypothetical protein
MQRKSEATAFFVGIRGVVFIVPLITRAIEIIVIPIVIGATALYIYSMCRDITLLPVVLSAGLLVLVYL